jgi:hypothetical protein
MDGAPPSLASRRTRTTRAELLRAAALAGAGTLAAWSVQRSFAGRLDLLSQALEASSDAVRDVVGVLTS